MRAAALFLALLVHDESISTSRIDVGRRDVTVAFTMSLEDLWTFTGPGAVDEARFAAALPEIADYLRARVRFWNDGAEMTSRLVRGEHPGGAPASARASVSVVLRYESEDAIGRLRMRCEAMRDRVKKHRHVADFADGATRIFEGDRVEAEWSPQAAPVVETGRFVMLGIEHILTGWDHLVFLLALLLTATSLRRVAILVTAFTAAHSVTLGLTALGLVTPPSAIVEAVIAASIVYVAVENWFVKDARWRWLLVFVFGLVHGMGFGGILLEMHLARPALALVGFNVGVELGQLLVVAVAYPLFALLRRREEWYRRWMVRGLSAAAAGVGVVWLVERLAGAG